MADIDGPYLNQTAVNTPTVSVIRASESQPAVFYCSYTCREVQEPHNRLYSFQLYVDTLDECAGHGYERIPVGVTRRNLGHFTVTTILINLCNQTSNVTTFEAQVSISSVTPRLLAKCVIEYFPNGQASDKINCSSSSTFAIIPNEILSCPTITSTSESTPSTSKDEETISTPEVELLQSNGTENYISPVVFGPIVGILGTLLVIETAILMTLLIVCFFNGCKKLKSQAVSDPVMFMNGETSVVGSGASNSKNKITLAIPMKTHDIPNLVQDDDSAVCTISTISDTAHDCDNNIVNDLNTEDTKK